MAAQKGKELLVKLGNEDGPPETFTALGGFRTNSLQINGETVDITNKDSNGFRELLDGAGIRSLSFSGSGVFLDDTQFAAANTAVLGGAKKNYEIIVPDFGTYGCAAIITSLEMAGEHNGEITYSISMESAGDVTFTAA